MKFLSSASNCLMACICLFTLANQANAETTVNDSFNDVTVGTDEITTGEESRVELSNSQGIFRVGSNSKVGLRRTQERTLDLQKGVMMVNTTRKGLGRQSVTVETNEIRATANATMIISYQPRRYIKIVCTEGKVKVSLKNVAKETVTIRKGQMLVINCLENVLPGAVNVDMSQLMRTSPLFAQNLRGGPARSAGFGRPGLANNGRPSGSSNGRGGPPRQAQQGPPPGANRGFRLPHHPARPQANNLAVRRIDCTMNQNAPECRTPSGAAQNGMSGGGSGGNMSGSNTPPPNMPPPNPSPPKK